MTAEPEGSPSTEDRTPSPSSTPARGAAPLAGLLVVPAGLGLASLAFPFLPMGEPGATVVAAAFPSALAVLGLAVASEAAPGARVRVGIGGIAATGLALLAIAGVRSGAAVAAVGASLAAGAWALGGGIGRRIEHAGHVGPACAIAAAADVASVLSPEGPTHAIAQSDAALSVLAIAGPVPGAPGAFAPTLGAGDLVFLALLLGAAHRHGIARWRVALAGAAGIAIALGASAMAGAAVPALPAIGGAAVIAVPAFRRLRARDRPAAKIAGAVAAAVAGGAIVRAWLG